MKMMPMTQLVFVIRQAVFGQISDLLEPGKTFQELC